jgi:hypothetical protein
MAAGVCTVTGGASELMQLELEMQCALREWIRVEFNGDAGMAAAALGVTGWEHIVGGQVTDSIAGTVGQEIVKKHGLGGAMLNGIALNDANKVAIGKMVLDGGGTAPTTLSKTYDLFWGLTVGWKKDIVVNVGAKATLSRGVQAGASLGAGIAGAGAEFVAGRFEGTKAHKKKIGFTAQVGAAAALGSAAGPAGAAAGAGVGAISWGASQVLGMAIEKAYEESGGNVSPAMTKYMSAKQRYDKARREGTGGKQQPWSAPKTKQSSGGGAKASKQVEVTPPWMEDMAPKDFICPITLGLMRDPVVASDGHTYERASISEWLQAHGTSPKTNCQLENSTLVQNITLRAHIEQWKTEQTSARESGRK